jgi:hypothetical protein
MHGNEGPVCQPIPVADPVDRARDTPFKVTAPVLEASASDTTNLVEQEKIPLTRELWAGGPIEFSATPTPTEAIPGTTRSSAPTTASSGFLGKAVGTIHESRGFWKETFEKDVYVLGILKNGYKIPVRMTPKQRLTIYREKNNKSARTEMDFVRTEVARLVAAGQVVEVAKVTKVTNPLSVAFKVNPDGSIKKRLVIDLSRWVNNFVKPDVYRMSRFQDALDQLDQGDFQSVYDVSKAYHHIRLHPELYKLVGFCVVDTTGKERLYHFVVVVFGLGPAGQLLGRMMRPILRFLTLNGVWSMVYVDDGWVAAATKAKADADYGLTIAIFTSAGFVIAIEKSDRVGDSSQRKEYLGFIIDTSALTVEVPQQKLLRVK